MLRRIIRVSAVWAAVGLWAVTGWAQEGSVELPFDGESLQVNVIGAGGAGQVEIVDGPPGGVIIADAVGGSAVRLEGGVLSLTNRSGAALEYRVEVPPSTNVALHVNGRPVLAMASAAAGSATVGPASEGGPAPGPRRSFAVNAYVGSAVVDSVDVAYPERIEMLKIVAGGDRFVVSGDRAVDFGFHKPTRWGVITPRAADAEVTVELPAGLRDFKLRIGDTLIWEMSDGVAKALCQPVAEIQRRDGRTLWSFTPQAGRLECPAVREGPRLGEVARLGTGSSVSEGS